LFAYKHRFYRFVFDRLLLSGLSQLLVWEWWKSGFLVEKFIPADSIMLCYKGKHCQWAPGKTDWTLRHRNSPILAVGENYAFYIIFRYQILKDTPRVLQTSCGYW